MDAIELCRPPDDDIADMIEESFLAGRITALQAILADLWARQYREADWKSAASNAE